MARALNSSFAFLAAGLLVACGSSGDDNITGGSPVNGAGGGGAADAGAGADSGAGGSFLGNTGGTAGKGGGGKAGSAGGTAAGGAGASGATGAGGTGVGGITSVTPVAPGTGCADEKLQASGEVLDIFIMQDRSGSMSDSTANGQSKWTVVTSAIDAFVADPQSAGIGAGIGFFGNDGSDNPSCDAATYATPVVGIAPLNGNARPISNAIANVGPAGHTPTDPALQGALDYARSWAQKNPTHKVVVVLATDGAPNGCNSSAQGAAAIAASGVTGTPAIPTYVIGVIGQGTGDGNCPNGPTQNCQFVQTLNSIAKSGGTGTAFIVNTAGTNTQTQFENAMNAIRNANGVGCIFNIPPAPSGKVVDLTKATVQYTPGSGAVQVLPWDTSAATCNGGWYYDSLAKPSKIHLCPGICSTINADPKARVDVIVACKAPGSGAGGAGQGGSGSGAGGTGSGAGGTGQGGRSGAGGAVGAGGAACLLDGQSCQTGSDCCGGTCTGGVCATIH